MLVSLCGCLLERSTKGGLIVVGSLNLGGSVDMIANPVAIAELSVEKGAAQLLMPISARRQLLDLPDEMAVQLLAWQVKDAAFFLQRPQFEVLELEYADTLANPRPQAERIARFLGGALDADKMASVVDSQLYRNRA